MKKHFLITIIVAGAALISACNSGYTRRNPGKTYAADMTYSRAYDAYTENPVLRNKQTSQPPVEGTVARGQAIPTHLTATDSAGYKALTHSYTFSDADIAEGQRLYNIYCGICHGAKLDGNGPLYASGKFAAMPANITDPKFKAYTEGQIYHVIMDGKGMMGSYAAQLNDKQRWMVVDFIQKTIGSDGAAVAASADTATAVASADTAKAKK